MSRFRLFSVVSLLAFALLGAPSTLAHTCTDGQNQWTKKLYQLPDPLARYRYLSELSACPSITSGQASFLQQLVANELSSMAAYAEAEQHFAPTRRNTDLPPEHAHALPALEWLREASRTRQVVMVNEAHTIARTRLLTLALLKPLREAGFTHLALETLSHNHDSLIRNGYPEESTGYYTNEPVFSHIVRQALALGYTLVAYEYQGDDPSLQARESGQAENLAAVLARQPEAKILVHAGHGHVSKQGFGADLTRTMAMEFMRLTGIDPLVVEQTRLLDSPDPARANPAWQAGLARWQAQHGSLPREPFVLVGSNGQPWALHQEKEDISVFAAPWEDAQAWRALGGLRARRDLPDDDLCRQFPYLIEARYAAEPESAIPADRQLLLKPGSIRLWLGDGCYRLRSLPQAADAPREAPQVCFP